MRHTFSASGAAQLEGDVKAIEKVIDTSIDHPGESARGMRRLNEGVRLLGLPIRPSTSTSKSAAAGAAEETEEEAWGFDNDDDNNDSDEEANEATDDTSAGNPTPPTRTPVAAIKYFLSGKWKKVSSDLTNRLEMS